MPISWKFSGVPSFSLSLKPCADWHSIHPAAHVLHLDLQLIVRLLPPARAAAAQQGGDQQERQRRCGCAEQPSLPVFHLSPSFPYSMEARIAPVASGSFITGVCTSIR